MNASTRQHTPGPWDVNEPDSKGGVWVDARDGLTVARVGGGVSPVAEAIANARLIASSPELLSALESIAALEPSIMSKQAEEGFRYHAEEDAYRIHLAGLINQARAIARAAIAKATEGGAE